MFRKKTLADIIAPLNRIKTDLANLYADQRREEDEARQRAQEAEAEAAEIAEASKATYAQLGKIAALLN